MAILFIGDVHGEFDKLNSLINFTLKHMEFNEVVVVGDFGYFPNWSDYKPYANPFNFPVRFIDGNHENHDMLNSNPPNNYISRGTYHDSIFYCGGATSIDKSMRIEGHDWFRSENISQSIFYNLPESADTMICHDTIAPLYDYKGLRVGTTYDKNARILNEIFNILKPTLYIHGHHHMAKTYYWKGCRFDSLNTISYFDTVGIEMMNDCTLLVS